MLTPAMFRRLAIAVAVFTTATFFAAEGFAMANTKYWRSFPKDGGRRPRMLSRRER